MNPVDRRSFVMGMVLTGVASAAPGLAFGEESKAAAQSASKAVPALLPVDFRYRPRAWQSTFCFPDDVHKSLVGEHGDLRYGFPLTQSDGPEDFATLVDFTLQGMPSDAAPSQRLHAPGVPIIYTTKKLHAGTLELTTFATNFAGEGRVDNVLLTVTPAEGSVMAAPLVRIRSAERLTIAKDQRPQTVLTHADGTPFLLAAMPSSNRYCALGHELGGCALVMPAGEASHAHPLRCFYRFPQEGQSVEQLSGRTQNPDEVLAESLLYWSRWKACEGEVEWRLPEPHQAFLISCARNIQQAREVKNGQSVFQVGPTVYRGQWIVDGSFLLEAARYLGDDRRAEEGMRAQWGKQQPDGSVVAGGGAEHWKDTGIAIYTLTRQCELAQDWSLFHELQPNVLRAVDFLIQLRDKARGGDSVNGKYGLLAPGFCDGGIDGVRSEFTNTLWSLAGLRALVNAAKLTGSASFARAERFYGELLQAMRTAAEQEMVTHPAGFRYLPMLAKGDPSLQDDDPWNRPRPQSAQWALSHAIFPGLLFDANDPIVRGHIALMQWCTREEIPAETGWTHHEGVWNYGASFAAHVYLWAGLAQWAQSTFTGFLNHASPLYCWREEQPLQNALISGIVGDMPHNWASAECIRFLRHMLVLEDGQALRLLAGITPAVLQSRTPWELVQSPTRFGRVSVRLEPSGHSWALHVQRASGPRPQRIVLPRSLGPTLQFARIEGAHAKVSNSHVELDPAAMNWTAVFG